MTVADHVRFLVPNLNVGRLRYAVEKETAILVQLDVYTTVLQILNALSEVKADTPLSEMKRISELVIRTIDRAADWGTISAKYLTDLDLKRRWAERRLESDLPAPIRELDNAYRRSDVHYYILRPMIAKNVQRLRRLRAWFVYHNERARHGG
jgi:hypothetical protein